MEAARADVGELSAEEFGADRRRLRSVAYCLVVIGEAASDIPDEILARAPEVPWPLMRGMRNRIVHEYFDLAVEILWDTVQEDLPGLQEPLERLLSESE